ncbi:MAG: TrkA family potassium uptake protein [Oscillospiraceae bacterium]|nr:TrkA family potassium uptake protein [Oscillospiraceae bacterium]
MLKKNKKGNDKYIVIIGCGRLGAYLANTLADEGRDVLILDRNEDSLNKLYDSYGGLTLTGDGTDLEVLKEANLDKANAVIVVTNNDNANVMIAQMAQELFQVDLVIARLYDPERECVYREFHIDTICPSTLSAMRIDKILSCGEGSGDEAAAS